MQPYVSHKNQQRSIWVLSKHALNISLCVVCPVSQRCHVILLMNVTTQDPTFLSLHLFYACMVILQISHLVNGGM